MLAKSIPQIALKWLPEVAYPTTSRKNECGIQGMNILNKSSVCWRGLYERSRYTLFILFNIIPYLSSGIWKCLQNSD